MWVFFEDGTFYSAVQNKFEGQTGKNVRSRDRRSSELLANWVEQHSSREVNVIETFAADYQFRVILTDEEWTAFVTHKAETAKASNFKSEVSKNLGYTKGKKFLDALHDVWSVMHRYQSEQRRAEFAPKFEAPKKKKNDKKQHSGRSIQSFYSTSAWNEAFDEDGYYISDWRNNRGW